MAKVLPKTASKLNMIAVWVELVYFCATVCIKKAAIVLNKAKYNMGIMVFVSREKLVPSNIRAKIKDNIAAVAIWTTDMTYGLDSFAKYPVEEI